MNEQFAVNSFSKFKEKDPFPNIASALLNSADIRSYAEMTGMIHPFREGDLKSASYAARISGKCKFRDEKTGEFKEKYLEKEGDKLVLKPNSIAFVGIEPTFRLPDYIALRFNLKITHVYRGLLLGTGPLIDPGFVGKISIPLHNLTSNDYVFSFDEALIWIEFTKTSPIPNAPKISKINEITFENTRCITYKPFPAGKTEKNLDDYLRKALEQTRHDAVVSSVPSAVGEALKHAESAKKYATVLRNVGVSSAIAILVAVIIGIGTLVYQSWSLQNQYYNEAISQISMLRDSLAQEIITIQEKQDETNNTILNMKQELEALKSSRKNITNDQKN